VHFQDGNIDSTAFLPEENKHIPSQKAGMIYLQLLDNIIRNTSYDILITYGSYWLGKHLLNLSHNFHLKNVFLLQNLAYTDASNFQEVDLTY
jgi:hypothetical protein